jgi:putative endonuclease
MKRYGVYLMFSRPKEGAIYTGMSGQLEIRTAQNAGQMTGGATWALKYKARCVGYYEICEDYTQAREREEQIKGWKREWKIDLIERMNPLWEDLRWEMEKKLAP